MLRTSLPPVLALSIALLAAAPAWPCSPLVPSLWGETAPLDQQEEVPLNARLVIQQPVPATNARALLDDGVNEPREVGMFSSGQFIVVTLESMEPLTDYTVTFEVPEDGASEGREPVRFRTAEATDERPPRITESGALVSVQFRPGTPIFVDSCGGGAVDRWDMRFDPPGADDEGLVAGYRLLEVDDRGGLIERSVRVASEEGVFYSAYEPGEKTYRFEVFDLAGNATLGEPFVVQLYAGGGCSATQIMATDAPLVAFAVLPLVGLLLRRRRRRAP